jgi:hypothetical protein
MTKIGKLRLREFLRHLEGFQEDRVVIGESAR